MTVLECESSPTADLPVAGSLTGLFGVIEIEASETDGDDDEAAAQDGKTSDGYSEEASGNAIKATHGTLLGSKRHGADELIKTFGILDQWRKISSGTCPAFPANRRFGG